MMGSIYMEHVVGIKNPRVGIVNIGVEEEKGNALVKETYPLLKENPYINFVGSIEAREIPNGAADVVVCEAFVGNVILKLYEGVGATLISKVKQGMMTSLRSKIGALLVKPALKETLKSFDASEYGGAPLLGLKGLVVKTHGTNLKIPFSSAFHLARRRFRRKCRSIWQTIRAAGRQRKMEFEKLQEIIADVLNVDPNEVTMETTFADDLGADSLDVFQIVMGIEEEFDIQIEAEEAEHIVSVEDAVEAIKKKLAE